MSNLPPLSLYESIYTRYSVRKYENKKITELYDEIKDIFAGTVPLDPGIKTSIAIYDKGNVPCEILLMSEKKAGWLENIGYIGEQLVLFLTAKGLGTCWVGMPNRIMSISGKVGHIPGMDPVIIINCGWPAASLMCPMGRKRRPMQDIVQGEMDSVMTRLLEAARIAPSAVNGQPWRFKVDDGKLHVFCCGKGLLASTFTRNLIHIDIGIVLTHVSIAAFYYNLQTEFMRLPEIENGKNNPGDYFISVDFIKLHCN